MARTLGDITQANAHAAQAQARLFKALQEVQGAADDYREFATEGTCHLAADVQAEIGHTTDTLVDLSREF